MYNKYQFNKDLLKSTADLITVGQAAKLIGVHPNTIRRWEKEGRIKSQKIGKRKERRFDKKELLQDVLNVKVIDGQEEARGKYFTYLKSIFKKAIKKNPVQFLYTILQVSGIHYGHWDPTEELKSFFDDFSELLEQSKPNSKRQYRIALVMYCHALEMSLPLDMLVNTVQIINGKNYNVTPFFELRRKNKSFLGSIAPSLVIKVGHLDSLVNNEVNLIKYIKEFFREDIRNAFYHSDYCLTEKEFRYSKNGIWQALPLRELDKIITRCFAFYEAFFHVLSWAKLYYKNVKSFHKWLNYEVFELLKNDKEVFGFKVHFSNGQVAKFSREPEKVEAINLHFENDGSVNFFAGNLDALEKAWKVNGKVVHDTFFQKQSS